MTREAFSNNNEAKKFLIKVFEWLDEKNYKYCVQRNYQFYPHNITGDVDLVVEKKNTVSIADGLICEGKKCGWNAFIKYAWYNTAHIGFYKDVYPERNILVIELFAGAGWHGTTYLPEEEIIRKRIRHGITWKPYPSHQAIITMIHHLLYNGHVPFKYRDEIYNLYKEDKNTFKKCLKNVFGKNLTIKTENIIVKKEWDKLVPLIRHFKFRLLCNSIRRPNFFLKNIGNGLRAVIKSPKGIILGIFCNDYNETKLLSNSLIEEAKRWHIFMPPYRKIFFYDQKTNIKKIFLNITLYLIHKRGGVGIVVINKKENYTINIPFLSFIIKINAKKDRIVYLIFSKSIKKTFDIKFGQKYENTSMIIWDIILSNIVGKVKK